MVRSALGASLSRPLASFPHDFSPEADAAAPNCSSRQTAIKAPTRTVKLLGALAFARAKNNTAADQLARRCLPVERNDGFDLERD